MKTRRQKQIAVAFAALLVLVPVGTAVAQTLTFQATEGVTLTTNSGVEVTLGDDRNPQSVPFADDNTFADDTLRIGGSDAQIEITDNSYSSDPISVRNVDVTGSLTVDRTDLNRQFTVEDGDASLIQMRDYAVGDGVEDFAYASDNGLTLTLSGFDPIGIAAVDAGTGEPIDDAAVDSSGEFTIDLPPGQRAIRLKPTPSDLEVRNEINPDQLVDGNVTLRARLFAGDTVIERQVTDGTVSLEGVPLDEELIITVKETNADFVYRRILIDSAIQTSEIYLLPTTEPSAEVEFQLRDDTGRFDPDDTKLFVEKPVTRNNDTEYRVISGDRIGGDGRFPTILVDSERYRLRVENDAGEQRVLGSYTVQGAERTTLPIGEVEFTADVSEGAALQANLREADPAASHNHEVRLVYVDPEAETDSVDIKIEDSSGAAIRPETTENVTGSEAYVETYPITDPSFNPEEDTATVSVEAVRGGEIETFEKILGDVPDILTDAGIDPGLLELAGLVSIVAVVGLLVIVNSSLAALVGTGYAGLLTLVGVVSIPMPAVVLAGLVSVLATIGTRNGVFS